MKIVYLLFIAAGVCIFSCTHSNKELKNIPGAWLDAIKKNSDSNYSKPYYRTDFVTADYYFTKKDSSLCQLMKDSAGHIVQVIIVTKNVRTFFGQYYTNGQLQAHLPLDEFGQYDGDATYYYSDGVVKSKGAYSHNLQTGEWKNYNEKGKLISKDDYGSNASL